MFTFKLISLMLLVAAVSTSGIPGHFGFAPSLHPHPHPLPHTLFAAPPVLPPYAFPAPVLPPPVLPPPALPPLVLPPPLLPSPAILPAPILPAPALPPQIFPAPVLNTAFIPPAPVFHPAAVFHPPPAPVLPFHPHVYASHPFPLASPALTTIPYAVPALPPPPPPPVVKTLVPGTLTKTHHTISVGYPIVKTFNPLIKANYFKHLLPSSHAHLHAHSHDSHLHGFGHRHLIA